MGQPAFPSEGGFVIREAVEADVPVILQFIIDLAGYEKLSHAVVATEESLTNSLFRRKMAEVIIGELDREPIGFALFFHNYSTFLGQAGIYLEDLFIIPAMRGRGFGKSMLKYIARLAVERDCGRFEWSCLDWNEPSIQFYKSLGAEPLEDWTIFRATGQTLKKMAAQ